MQKNDMQYVVSMLKDTNYKAVATAVGLSHKTVWSIAVGRNQTPSFNTVRVLAEYFRGKA